MRIATSSLRLNGSHERRQPLGEETDMLWQRGDSLMDLAEVLSVAGKP